MALNKFFRFPFAVTGDKTAVPEATQPSGDVSYQQGYGPDYARDPATDPLAKNIERDKMNNLFYDITTAIREYQIMGTPDFITSAQNGGTAFPYSKCARIRYNDGSSFKIYQSKIDNNTDLPTVTASWDDITAGFNFASYIATQAQAEAGTDNTTAMTPLRTVQSIAINVPAASTSAAGKVQLASTTEAQTGTDTAKAVTAAGVSASIATVQGAFKNLSSSANGTNANVIIAADEIVVENAANNYRTIRNVNITINSAETGANGLDTGTLSASTWYSTWVIYNPTTLTTAGLISLSSTSPTMPSGYTHKARTGWIRTDSTANKFPLSFVQNGRTVQYKAYPGSNVTALPVMASGIAGSTVTPTWSTFSTTPFIPPTAHRIYIHLPAGNNYAMVAPTSVYRSRGASNAGFINGYAVNGSLMVNFAIEVPGSVAWASDGTGCQANCLGWEDNL